MLWFVLYIASIVLANALLKIVGTVPVANQFWRTLGFDKAREETTKTGRLVNVWRLNLSTAPAATDASRKSR